MAPCARNVIPLKPRRSSEDLPVPLERLGVAVQELDDLRRCIRQIIDEPGSSALEWSVACMPLMLRLPGARRSLADLAEIRVGRWPDTDWAVRIRAARDEVERGLQDISTSMNALIRGETSAIDAAVNLSFEGTELAEAVNELCWLIASQYPEAVGGI